MLRTAVLTDSSSDLEPLQAEQLGIQLLLLAVEFDGRPWLDHLELDSQSMFNRMQGGAKVPTMRLPTPNHYLGVIDNLLHKYDHVLAIHTSPLIGRVHTFAVQALEASQYRDKVTVVNSGATSIGLALQAERAVNILSKGLSPNETVHILRTVQHHQCSRLTVTTLEYLRRAKLVSGPTALIGELQDKKPVFALDEGRLQPVYTARGEAQALKYMLDSLRRQARDIPESRIAFVNNGNDSVIDALRQEAQRLGIEEVMHARLGAVISSFAGPNAYGFTLEPRRVWHQFNPY